MALPSNTNIAAPSATQQHLTLPSPQLFDILPALHELLARIDHAPAPTSTPAADLNVASFYAPLQPLDPKELSNAILPLKTQMRKGLREIEKLPDIERSVQEQEEEIAELEARIRKQEEVFRGLARSVGEVEGELGGRRRAGKVAWG